MRVVTSPDPETPFARAQNLVRHRHPTLPWLAALMLLSGSGCGTGGGPPPKGTSSGVTWEIVDIGQLVSPDHHRMRWSYTIVLRETTGCSISFEAVERGAYASGDMIGGTHEPRPFRRTLAAHGELRYSAGYDWGWTAQSGTRFGAAAELPPVTVEYRFVGRTSGGAMVGIVARIRLDRSVGTVVTPLSTTRPLPPSRPLATGDLETLAGRWRGSFRTDGDVFDVPVEIVIRPDGAVEVATNDPVTNRFRATVSIRDGDLTYAGTSETGTLKLHEREGQRVLAGYVSGPRQGPQAPVGYTIRVQWQGGP